MWNLLPNERKQFVARKHSFIFITETLFFILFAFLPYVIPEQWYSFIPLSVQNSSGESISQMAYMVWLLLLWIGFFVAWTNYFLDIWIITNKRIIDVDQKGLFRREIATLQVEHIVDMKIITPGFWGSILGYGSIEIQTAGAEKEFTIKNVRRPEEVKQKISTIQRKSIDAIKEVRVVR
ncbi:MAG: hypothetical protein ACI9AR_000428 [Flavobacteriaceae bacterium]|jgi:hypothetical protein